MLFERNWKNWEKTLELAWVEKKTRICMSWEEKNWKRICNTRNEDKHGWYHDHSSTQSNVHSTRQESSRNC